MLACMGQGVMMSACMGQGVMSSHVSMSGRYE